ncbi:MAG: cation diffusion facilitator family transporter [Candidatus Gastranaerophilales bacterium]|nr:cation diffusion facilitator family transporter [Candidatus Gastranaerophilales bacterium]
MHNHSHVHKHEKNNSYKLTAVLLLTAGYMVAEFLGGLFTNSLALLADSGHMLSDVAALGLSLFAIWLSLKPASPEKTYGYYRTEIIAAFINGITLVGIAFYIIWEAYTRFMFPQHVKAPVMIAIAVGGLLINIMGAVILHRSSKENLNIHGAFLHIIGDLLGSIGAIIAGVCILFWNFYLADPIISIIIALLVLYSAINLINEAANVLLEASPSHISVSVIEQSIRDLPDVINLHDLHVWSISSNNIALSVHIVATESDSHKILCEVDEMLNEKFGIKHVTIQLEPEGFHESGCKF